MLLYCEIFHLLRPIQKAEVYYMVDPTCNNSTCNRHSTNYNSLFTIREGCRHRLPCRHSRCGNRASSTETCYIQEDQHNIDIRVAQTFLSTICGNNTWMIKWKCILWGCFCSTADCGNNDSSCLGTIAGCFTLADGPFENMNGPLQHFTLHYTTLHYITLHYSHLADTCLQSDNKCIQHR